MRVFLYARVSKALEPRHESENLRGRLMNLKPPFSKGKEV